MGIARRAPGLTQATITRLLGIKPTVGNVKLSPSGRIRAKLTQTPQPQMKQAQTGAVHSPHKAPMDLRGDCSAEWVASQTGRCRVLVVNAVAVGVVSRRLVARSHMVGFGLVSWFVPANCVVGWFGSVLDHPPPTSSVGGQAPVGGLWWLAGKSKWCDGWWCGTGKGSDGCPVVLMLFVFVPCAP